MVTVGPTVGSWWDTVQTPSCPVAPQHGGTEHPGDLGAATEGPDPALSSRGTMAPGRGDMCHAQGTARTCAATQAALCKATARHRQLVLQLGGSADSPRLREERRRSSMEVRELSTGKDGAAAPTLGLAEGLGLPRLSVSIPQGCSRCC